MNKYKFEQYDYPSDDVNTILNEMFPDSITECEINGDILILKYTVYGHTYTNEINIKELSTVLDNE